MAWLTLIDEGDFRAVYPFFQHSKELHAISVSAPLRTVRWGLLCATTLYDCAGDLTRKLTLDHLAVIMAIRVVCMRVCVCRVRTDLC